MNNLSRSGGMRVCVFSNVGTLVNQSRCGHRLRFKLVVFKTQQPQPDGMLYCGQEASLSCVLLVSPSSTLALCSGVMWWCI